MAACDTPGLIKPRPDQDVAAEAFNQPEALGGPRDDGFGRDAHRAVRQAVENLFDQSNTLFDLADADPHACIDVTVIEDRHVELELVVGRIDACPARIESAPGRTPNIAPRPELTHQRGCQVARRHRAIL